MDTTVYILCFVGILLLAICVSLLYFKKKYSIDPITGEFIPESEIAENDARRGRKDIAQLTYDERCQIDESMRKIGEICPEFRQKYGKGMNILCHIERMKMLIREYDEIPNKEDLIKYQNEFYFKVYDSIYKDLYIVTEPYLIGRKEIEKKYKGKIDLRIELGKFVGHLERLKKISNSSNQTP